VSATWTHQWDVLLNKIILPEELHDKFYHVLFCLYHLSEHAQKRFSLDEKLLIKSALKRKSCFQMVSGLLM